MPTLRSYLRYSTKPQALGQTERRQVEKMRQWAIDHEYDFDDSYRDPATSGFRGVHRRTGALGRFLGDVRTGQIPATDLLGIESFDRLTREHSFDAYDLFHEVINSGVTVIVQSLGFMRFNREIMLTEPHLQHLVIAEMNRSHAESERKQEVSLDNRAAERREARLAKIPVTARCPPWLQLPRIVDGTKRERVEQRARRKWIRLHDKEATVVLIFTLAADGYSAARIANYLNDEGIVTLTGTPRWSRGQVQHILNNKSVIGVYQPCRYIEDPKGYKGRRRVADGEGEVDDYYPRIITDYLWQRARDGISGRAVPSSRGRKGTTVTNLLSGLGVCGLDECGSSVHYINTSRRYGDHPYLRCSRSLQHGACTNNGGFPYLALEPLLFRIYDFNRAFAELVPVTSDTTDIELAEKTALLDRKRKARAALEIDIDAFDAGEQRERMRDRLNVHAREIKQLEQERGELERQTRIAQHTSDKDFAARFAQAKELIASTDPEERYVARTKVAQSFRQIIERVTLHPNKVLVIRIKRGPRGGNQTEYVLSPKGIEELRVVVPDGQRITPEAMFFDRTVPMSDIHEAALRLVQAKSKDIT